jgi:hypothetical protein
MEMRGSLLGFLLLSFALMGSINVFAESLPKKLTYIDAKGMRHSIALVGTKVADGDKIILNLDADFGGERVILTRVSARDDNGNEVSAFRSDSLLSRHIKSKNGQVLAAIGMSVKPDTSGYTQRIINSFRSYLDELWSQKSITTPSSVLCPENAQGVIYFGLEKDLLSLPNCIVP